ncbi:MAG TPA: adenosine deaminase family protein [Spirochaetia bacterium]|nr:adenosine deaminase family protein [Spirochaetia bacterium]
MTYKYDPAFIRAIPKTDLHVHLDGSLRVSSLIEMARERKINLPSRSEEGLNETIFKPSYASLLEYLSCFTWTLKVLQDREGLERSAYELAMDSWAEGVRYLEVRFAPQLHISPSFTLDEVVRAVDNGLRRARSEINKTLGDAEPPFDYGVILCAMRFFTPEFSDYYRSLSRLLSSSSSLDIIRTAGLELARAAVRLRRETDMQVVGFDLAGSEEGYPASEHEEAYEYVHRHFLKKTVHAGEAYGPESVFQAIAKLHADRIGHGLHMFDEHMISTGSEREKKAYVENLVNYIAENRTTIEVCLTSNLQTSPGLVDVRDHSLQKMLDYRLSLTFCTDNRLVSHTSVTRELSLALDNFSIAPDQLKDIIVYGFKRSFYYHPYTEKRKWVRNIIDYYEKLEKQYRID